MPVKQKRQRKVRYADFPIDFTPHPLTGDIGQKTDTEAVKESVKNLLQTNRYERFFNPLLGSDINALLFENFSPVVHKMLEDAIRTTITNYEPRARIRAISISPMYDNNAINVAIVFSLINTSEAVNLEITLNRVR